MLYSPRWMKLMFTAGLALLPACGMEDPNSPEAQELDPETPTELGEARAELAVGTETSTLSARGGYGGVPGVVACPANQVAVGIHGTVGTYITSLGLLCRALNTDGTFGASVSTPAAGGGWGNPFTLQCPEGMAVVGFPGRSGWYVDSLGLHCAAPNAWMTSGQVQASVTQVGSYSGNAFSDVCPQERVVTQLNVRNGDNLDQEQAICTRMRPTPPASCREVKNANPSAADGEYTLYVSGDVSRPWKAYCHNMAGTPAEYLSLPSTGSSINFSQYTAGYNNGGGTNVRTLFSKLRINPSSLSVSTGDLTFSTSSGLLFHPNQGYVVTSVAYAAATNCDFGAPGLGNVDLRGTSFAVAPNQFVVTGYYPSGLATYSSDNRVVDLWGRGECGSISVQGAGILNGQGAQLQLQYAPPTSGSFNFNASNTSMATQNTTPFYVMLTAGQALQLGTCSVNGASGSGDTFLRLYAPDGTHVAANDDACGLLSFVGHTATQTGTYRIQAGCYNNGSCSGTVAFTIQ